jgi:hypothetical protein
LFADLRPQLLGHLVAERLHICALGVLWGQRVEIGEHLIEGSTQFSGDEVVLDVLELSVVQEQLVGRGGLDPPPHAVVDECRRVVAQAHRRRLLPGVVVDLNGFRPSRSPTATAPSSRITRNTCQGAWFSFLSRNVRRIV